MKWIPFLVNAVTTTTLGSLAESLMKHLAVFFGDIVLSGNVQDPIGPKSLRGFGESVEFLRLQQLREVASVENERRRSGQRIDSGDSFTPSWNVRICRLVEADVAVADLQELRSAPRLPTSCCNTSLKAKDLKTPP
jgi:hypothetical protein